ncbi:MAG: lysine 2,3-aminomutase, partial [Planctomycetota bacterium]
MSNADKYVPTAKESAFLETIENPKYDRMSINGLKPFLNEKAPEDMMSFYSPDEIQVLGDLKGGERDVEARMPVKMTRHYFELAQNSAAIQAIVKATPGETEDLEGADDPGHQMDYSPVPGLLHKYEMGLMYVISTCSAHCRFCYREELISRREVEHKDGTVAKKAMAQIGPITEYVRAHNKLVADNGGRHPETNREKLREILLSGGDPMVLTNTKLGAWFAALAEAGVESIRVGTKEFAFFPQRFDDAFLTMLDNFHAAYPHVGLRFMVHFNHPDEFLLKDSAGNYIEEEYGTLKWHPETDRAMTALLSRGWLCVENQSPIIKGVNDDADALRIMQRA